MVIKGKISCPLAELLGGTLATVRETLCDDAGGAKCR
jgi:hypothetical protein